MSDNYIITGKEHKIMRVTSLEWGEWMQTVTSREHSRVGDDDIEGVRISTVFLGLDHNWGGGKPLLFETMIFGGTRDEEQFRYTTWKQAERGHNKIVKEIKKYESLHRLRK